MKAAGRWRLGRQAACRLRRALASTRARPPALPGCAAPPPTHPPAPTQPTRVREAQAAAAALAAVWHPDGHVVLLQAADELRGAAGNLLDGAHHARGLRRGWESHRQGRRTEGAAAGEGRCEWASSGGDDLCSPGVQGRGAGRGASDCGLPRAVCATAGPWRPPAPPDEGRHPRASAPGAQAEGPQGAKHAWWRRGVGGRASGGAG